MTNLKKNELPNPTLVKHLLDLDEGTDVVWKATRRKASIPGLFATPPQTLIGFYAVDTADVAYLLKNGEWPVGADQRPEPHIHRAYFDMQWTLMQRNAARMEMREARKARLREDEAA